MKPATYHLQRGAPPSYSCVLEASTNLVDWKIIGVALDYGRGTFAFEDPNAARFSSRFYRVVSP